MKKRVLSIALALIMLFCVMPTFAEETSGDITVYLTLCKYGEIVESKDGEPMAYLPVTLSGGDTYNLDDVFKAAHSLYYPDGEAGYVSAMGDWGLGMEMLWGDTSYNFGYQVNAGSESVMGLEHQIEDGDYIDACIYQNYYPDTEAYSFFYYQDTELTIGHELSITLTYASGYDDNWNTIYLPCQDAVILINGEETEFITDENGQVDITFDNEGQYIVSAKKTKTLNGEIVPAITSPVCVVNVKAEPAIQIIHNIAKTYCESNLEAAGGNLPWILADMAVYEELFPESEYNLSGLKEDGLKLMVEFAKDAKKPGDISKAILAFRSMGYDPEKIFTDDYKHINLKAKLLDLVKAGDDSVTNIYTLPYVILALDGVEDSIVNNLLISAVESKESWLNTEFGTDALAPMILALAPYCDDEAVKTAVDEAVAIAIGEQREDGLIDGFEGYEAASTGLVICALSAVHIDCSNVMCGEKSLIDGILSVANDELNGFPNAFATEQGFRGLLAWQLLTRETGKNMYDFSEYTYEELNLTGANLCPVQFDVSPKKAKISINDIEKTEERFFDLDAGEYTYEITCDDYNDKTGTFVITKEDVKEHNLKEISVSLRRKSDGGISGGSAVALPLPTAAPQSDEIENKIAVFEKFADVSSGAWYVPAVQFVFDNGLFGGTDKGFEPEANMTRAMLVTVLSRIDKNEIENEEIAFDDVENDSWYAQGINWAVANGIINGVSETSFAPDDSITREQLATILYRFAQKMSDAKTEELQLSFVDSDEISEYATEALKFAINNGIISGRNDNMLCPKEKASRAEVATMIMRFMEVIK